MGEDMVSGGGEEDGLEGLRGWDDDWRVGCSLGS